MNEQSLAVSERVTMPVAVRQTPEEAIAEATSWAKALMEVVLKGRLAVEIPRGSGRHYLKVEAWQTVACFNKCWIDTEWTRDIKDDSGEIIGVEARARLVNFVTGAVLGGAEGACMLDEELEGRDGETIERWSEYYAIRSMAQTRAQGKVGRMRYAWIATLAGYEGTPAEEMGVGGAARKEPGLCPKCGKPAVIKGLEKYGGGWLCHKKRGGCGAKWTHEPAETKTPVTPSPEPGPSSPPTSTSEERAILLGRVHALADLLTLSAKERAALWQEHCGHATPETVDPAALQALYAALLARKRP